MNQIHEFLSYAKQTERGAILLTGAFLLLSIFVPSVKFFFILTFSYFSLLALFYSFTKAIVYSFIPMTFVSVGQTHPIIVVPAKAIINHLYWEGRQIIVAVHPHLIIWSVALLFSPIILRKSITTKSLLKLDVVFIIFLLGGVISAIYGSIMLEVSIVYVWGKIVGAGVLIYLNAILIQATKSEKEKILRTMFLIVWSFIVFEAIIVFRQMMTKSPVGVIIEQAKNTPSFGLGADESVGGFRPFGLHAHPNGLANDHILFLSLFSLLFLWIKKYSTHLAKMEYIFLYSGCFLSLSIIAVSLSRAAYIAVFFVSLFVFFRHKNEVVKFQRKVKDFLKNLTPKIKVLFIFFSFAIVMSVSNRLLSSIYSFSDSGGVNTRGEQYREAIAVFQYSPIWGIGDGMFIPTSYQLFPQGIMTYFPENVHNGFLLMLIERGGVGFLFYLVFLITLFREVKNLKFSSKIQTVIYSGILASFIMMMFHPEYNFQSIFILFSLSVIHVFAKEYVQN